MTVFRRILLAVSLILPLLVASYPSISASAFSPPALEDPVIDAEVAAVVDGQSGMLLYDKSAHLSVAPASLTKIMTAIVAIEHGGLYAVVAVDVDGPAMALEDGSSIMGITPGEELTLEDLLYGLMLVSGNDAARAIAHHVAGSEEAFVALMNQKAAELGMDDTHFANPHGLDDPSHYSSAYDMAILGRYAMRNPTFAKIAGTLDITVQGQRTYALHNINRILTDYPGADGIKTGYTDNAMQAIVATAERGGRRLFVALMRSHSRYDDAIALFDRYFVGEEYAPASDADWPIANGHFFTQTNESASGQSRLGYAVSDDVYARFWSESQRLGGVGALGYPVSQRYRDGGFMYQAFQRGILQWRPELGRSLLTNVFDQLSAAGKDGWLLSERSTPRPLNWSEDTGRSWEWVAANHLRLLDADPAIKGVYNSAIGDPVEMYGLPMTAVTDMGNVYVLRAQRAVFQRWKEDVPWAKAGEVTIALGGTIAREAGLIPSWAIKPEVSPE
jgi:D-alanyl-D-alanine carboxypeptidase